MKQKMSKLKKHSVDKIIKQYSSFEIVIQYEQWINIP